MPDEVRAPKIFKFINKDVKAISINNGKTGKAGVFDVNSHVQRVRQLRKQTQLIRETSSTKKLVGWQKAPVIERGPALADVERSGSSTPIYCPICDLDHTDTACQSSSVDTPIGSPSDPFESLILPIDVRVHRILQYYMTLRQPRGFTADSHVAGFTPLGKHDEQLSFTVVKRSFSSPTDLYAIALLAGMACRMKFFNGVPLAQRDYPEYYTVKAIQIFRTYLDSGQPINDRVVFAMHNLSMAEYCCKNFAGAKLYWQMTREMAIHLGGFAKFEPYIAWLCLSADYLIAASTFTLPELDFVKYPKLSGIDISTTNERAITTAAAFDGSAYCQPRLQVLITNAIALTQVIRYIQSLPEPATSDMRRLVMANRTAVYRLITMPLKRHDPTPAPSTSTDGAISSAGLEKVVLADAMVTRARHLGLVIWLWHSSLAISSTPALPENLGHVPYLMAEHVIELRTSMQVAEKKLANSSWAIREDLVLWLCSLITLVSSALEGSDFFVPEFVRVTKTLSIQSERQLEVVLAVYPPLSGITDHSVAKLYRLISMTSLR